MIPIVLNPEHARIAVVGNGDLAAKRLHGLRTGGGRIAVFAPGGDDRFTDQAGPNPNCRCQGACRDQGWCRRFDRLPTDEELETASAVWIADLDPADATALAERTRARGTLVNVEDVWAECDFHTPSVVRRGDLLMTVSTRGKSPGLAVRIRRFLERAFGTEWGERLDDLAERRLAWRAEGLPNETVAARTRAYLDERKWLDDERL